jgi:hypothetical protein
MAVKVLAIGGLMGVGDWLSMKPDSRTCKGKVPHNQHPQNGVKL